MWFLDIQCVRLVRSNRVILLINGCSQCHPAAAPLHRAGSQLVLEVKPIVMQKQRVDVRERVYNVEVLSVSHTQQAHTETFV